MISGELSALLARQNELAAEFSRLTSEQRALLESDEMTAFGKSLEQRQVVIDEIQRVRAKLSAFSGELTGAALLVYNDAMAIFRAAQAQNAANQILLGEKMAEISAAIQNLGNNQKGLGGYGVLPPSGASYFDKKL